MFAELKISEELLATKTKLKEDATKDKLNEIWVSFDKNTQKEEYNESMKEMKNFKDISSPWVLRKTPKVTDNYTINQVLGNPGQYGVVKEGICKKTKEKYAIKFISKRRFRDRKLTASFFADLRGEVHLMYESREHPFIIKVREVYEDINNLQIVMSYCSGGELFDRIQEDDGFSESKASEFMRQMLSALYYLHNRGIAHCDLKPENFILTSQNKSENKLKLIDFGMAKIVRWRTYYKRMNGTPYYIAPEVLAGKYNESCDMWSLGVILFIMIFGFPPFFDPNESTNDRNISDKIIYKKIEKGFTPKVKSGYGAWFPSSHTVSSQCRDLISRLLRVSVADRITAEEALEHPWIKNLKKNDKKSNSKLQRINNPTVIKSIRFFNKESLLQTQVLKLLKECNYLNSTQVDEVKKFFKAADTDGDGKISKEELHKALKNMDKTLQEDDIKSIIKAMDADNNGFLDFDELLSSRINRKLQSKEARLRKVFGALDLDNNGYITLDELKAALESVSDSCDLTNEKILNIINEVDKNNDGKIDFEEFITAFKDGNDSEIVHQKLFQ